MELEGCRASPRESQSGRKKGPSVQLSTGSLWVREGALSRDAGRKVCGLEVGSYPFTSPTFCLPEAAAAADPEESPVGRTLASSVDGESGPKEGSGQLAETFLAREGRSGKSATWVSLGCVWHSQGLPVPGPSSPSASCEELCWGLKPRARKVSWDLGGASCGQDWPELR